MNASVAEQVHTALRQQQCLIGFAPAKPTTLRWYALTAGRHLPTLRELPHSDYCMGNWEGK